MFPKSIPILRKEDYHTDCLGHYGNKQQYMGFVFYVIDSHKIPVSVLHLLDSKGNHINSELWTCEKINLAEEKLKAAVNILPNAKPGNIRVRPFEVLINGIRFGIIPREDGKCLEYQPYGLAFFPPWNGIYDT